MNMTKITCRRVWKSCWLYDQWGWKNQGHKETAAAGISDRESQGLSSPRWGVGVEGYERDDAPAH